MASGTLPAVSAARLARRFGAYWAVRDITWTLPPGSVLLVVGPNGSGKTTLLRLLSTALRPTSGAASVFGHDLVRDADAVRRLVALVGASPGVYDLLTPQENLRFAAAMTGRRNEPVHPWLERVNLTHVANRLVRTLSRGMQRRLALARAWLAAPRLLLLDEPYSGLDRDGMTLVDAIITDTTRHGGSVVIATHDWERAAKAADTVLAVMAGQAVEIAPAAQLTAAELAAAAGGIR